MKITDSTDVGKVLRPDIECHVYACARALAEDAPENRQSDRSSRRSGEVLLRGKSLLEQWSE